MIRNTFCHIRGISASREQALWNSGIRSWDDWPRGAAPVVGTRQAEVLAHEIEQSREQLARRNVRFFADGLPSRQVWRTFPEFRKSIAYIDIETTGLYCSDSITTIALYDGENVRTFVNGRNLPDFEQVIRGFDLIVTYNGKCFDVPFIERFFHMSLDHAHIDLRYLLRSLGYSGGLKGCERALGMDRGDLEGIDGYFAVCLWNEYRQKGDETALETLLAYNAQDVINLEHLLTVAYNEKLKETPFEHSNRVTTRANAAANPYRVHRRTVERIRSRYFWSW